MNLKTLGLPRSIVAAGAALVLVLSLNACAPGSSEFDTDAASLLQSSVADVTDAAAAGDPAAALVALDVLQEQLNENTSTGAIGAERSARIQASLDLVRADLTAALPDPTPTADPANGNDKDDKGGKEDKGNKGNKGNKDDKGNKNG
mgnify:FL=1